MRKVYIKIHISNVFFKNQVIGKPWAHISLCWKWVAPSRAVPVSLFAMVPTQPMSLA